MSVELKEVLDDSVQYNYRQVTCQRAVAGDSFPLGVQDFNWSIGGNTAFVPAKSYFRIGMTITGGGGTQPSLGDTLALADNVCGNLYNNIYMRCGGSDVSSLVNYVPQAQQVKTRLTKSKAWLDGIGKSAFGCDANIASRINSVSVLPVGDYTIDNSIVTSVGTRAHRNDATIAITNLAGGATVTGVNTGLQYIQGADNSIAGRPGDILVVGGVKYTIATGATDALGAGMTVSNPPANNVGPTTNAVWLRSVAIDGSHRNTQYVLWQPPIGIFDNMSPMGAADYRISLNPNSNYKTAAVENSYGRAEYDFVINDVQFFMATISSNIPASGVDSLYLTELQVQSKQLSPGASESLLDFTVPPSTKAISVFVQGNQAGSIITLPPSCFRADDFSDQDLRALQVTYANTSKPSTKFSSSYSSQLNYMKQRYVDTQLNSGMFFNDGSGESYSDWQRRGGLYHFSFVRDSNDRSTNVQLALQFGNIDIGVNAFICAHYTRRVDITTQNGFVTSVESLNT